MSQLLSQSSASDINWQFTNSIGQGALEPQIFQVEAAHIQRDLFRQS